MSEKLYREANSEPDYAGGTLYPREAAAVQMWVVPVTVDDLDIEAMQRAADHGNMDLNRDELEVLFRAALGGTDGT